MGDTTSNSGQQHENGGGSPEQGRKENEDNWAGALLSFPARPAERIPEVLDVLRAVWSENPNQRLTQLLHNALKGAGVAGDSYQVEDDTLLKALQAFDRDSKDGGTWTS